MRTTRRPKSRPSKEQVRVWLTTVIAPLGRALTVEQHRVSAANWSFRCHSQDFEFLWPVERMVGVPYLPNLEQLFRHRSELKKLADAHDRTLDNLRSAAKNAYGHLIRDDRFRELASSTSAPELDHRYFAEYVVNGLRDLESYYSLHELWSLEGAKFLSLREDPALARDFRALEASGRDFAQAVNALDSTVSALQIELADAYRLPPVDPVDTAV